MRRHVALITAVLVGAMLAAAWTPRTRTFATIASAQTQDTLVAPVEPTTTTVPPTTTSTTAKPSAPVVNLEPKLVSALPSGYARQPDDVGNTGPSNLDKAVRDDAAADARQALAADGYVTGYSRLWASGNNAIIDVLYLFADPTGAANYIQRRAAGFAKTGGQGTTITEFAVAGIPGARGFLAHSDGGDAAIVAFTRGAYAVQISLNGTDATPEVANHLATAQYNKAT